MTVELIAAIQTDLFALCVLGLIFNNLRRRLKSRLFAQKIFYAIIAVNALMLTLDIVLWLLNGAAGPIARAVNIVLCALYFSCNPLPCVFWYAYVDYQIYGSRRKILHSSAILFVPALAVTAFSILSCRNGCLFYFDAGNVYHRGEYFWLFASLCIAYLALTQCIILLNRKKIAEQFMLPITLFAVPPIAGAVIQSFIFGTSLVWPCMTLSVLVIFLNIQNGQLYIDHLTGLYNRRHLDYFLNERAADKKSGTLTAGIMVDLNSFKSVNDNFGHAVGDQALVEAGKILRSSIRSTDFACRYGGDEFVVILEIRRRQELDQVVGRIRRNVRRYNEEKHPNYVMSFSMGYDVFEPNSGEGVKQFIRHIDSLMYEDKKKQKSGTV